MGVADARGAVDARRGATDIAVLDEVLRRSDFDLSGLVDSTYSPLKEGRVLGVEMQGKL